MSARSFHLHAIYTLGYPRELLVAWLLFLIGGWGLARDIQLEQRLDVTLGSHEKLSAELAEARLNALRADLDPHFLFNALNAIASQCTSDPVAAEDNVVRLAALLRAVLDTRRRALHPLEDELSLARDYVGLLAARYPSLRVTVTAEPRCAAIEVPPLVLQPLLENAVRHGDFERGTITVDARAEGADLVMTVESPGAFDGPREGGMGLSLVRRRVELAWGARGTFTIAARAERTVATITARDSAARKPS
jgi:LytS/YehU family sensor histidine kinase